MHYICEGSILGMTLVSCLGCCVHEAKSNDLGTPVSVSLEACLHMLWLTLKQALSHCLAGHAIRSG